MRLAPRLPGSVLNAGDHPRLAVRVAREEFDLEYLPVFFAAGAAGAA